MCLRCRRETFLNSGTSASTTAQSRPIRSVLRPPEAVALATAPAASWLMSGPYSALVAVYIFARQLVLVGAAARQDHRAALRADTDRLVHGLPEREAVGEP